MVKGGGGWLTGIFKSILVTGGGNNDFSEMINLNIFYSVFKEGRGGE